MQVNGAGEGLDLAKIKKAANIEVNSLHLDSWVVHVIDMDM